MDVKTKEIGENKIVEAVQYAISTSFNLDELSKLLVMEGGVDLDTLARIIRENRKPDDLCNDSNGKVSNEPGSDSSNGRIISLPAQLGVDRPSDIQQTAGKWFGLKAVV